MIFEAILIFLLLRFMRRTLKNGNALKPEWDKYILYASIGVWVLFVVTESALPDAVGAWVGHLCLVALLYILYKRPEFYSIRNVLYALVPFVALSMLKDILKLPGGSFFKKVDDIMDWAIPFTIVWMIVMWIVSNKQQRALANERKKREEEEKINKITSAQKSQLELMVAERTAELTQQKEELQHALSELKNTQSQLVHSEKMASLGELTAGIAHEIQNPLNFVNNFAEVNMELLDELKQESSQGKAEQVNALVSDIRHNLEKIHYHGRRADAIVKGMLQHSRTSTGQKEEVQINTLVEEYMGLSYHGMRAKDKGFNVALKYQLDPQAGAVKIIPQDIGRVLLNVFNNAFYAVKEKKQEHISGFEPTVTISTKRLRYEVEIRVKDNGNGIPEKILDKIFQPFFTTKPTGQGTGLGLSLSYDIITKGHGGKMFINNKEGEYAEFVILLPIS